MAKETVRRRLAAILAADVAGYARLVGEDEEGTLARLKSFREELIDPSVARDNGRIVKTMGDGLLIEFPSVVDAVRNAVDVQRAMADRNAGLPDDRRMEFRVGINLGDIVTEGDDILGDGVNIAARMETLASPGGICLSGAAHDQVEGKLDLAFEDLGEQEVKNIRKPVRVYRVCLDAEGRADRPGAAEAGPVLTLPDKPSIAVLPFENMSGDPEQTYFSDGISEDITTELSRFHSLFVISRNSAFAYKGEAVDVKRVGRELGVRYVVEGSVRRVGDRVRVTAQLVDAQDGHHVWAERFERDIGDIFAVQDEITETVASTLAGRIQAIDTDHAKRKATESMAAYDYLLRGLDLHKGGAATEEDLHRAVEMFQKAVELDPGFARAHAWLSCSASRLWPDDVGDEHWDENLARVALALELDDNEAEAHRISGAIHMWKREFDRAAFHIDRSVSLNPNDAHIAVKAGAFYGFAGQPAKALALIRRAMRLNPLHPDWYWQEYGIALHSSGQPAEAVRAFERNSAPSELDHAYLAACYGELGQPEKAQKSVEELLRVRPEATIGRYRRRLPYKNPEDLRRLLDGLSKAGLPE